MRRIILVVVLMVALIAVAEARTPNRVSAIAEGLIPGFRVWALRAYDGNNGLIVELSRVVIC